MNERISESEFVSLAEDVFRLSGKLVTDDHRNRASAIVAGLVTDIWQEDHGLTSDIWARACKVARKEIGKFFPGPGDFVEALKIARAEMRGSRSSFRGESDCKCDVCADSYGRALGVLNAYWKDERGVWRQGNVRCTCPAAPPEARNPLDDSLLWPTYLQVGRDVLIESARLKRPFESSPRPYSESYMSLFNRGLLDREVAK